MIKQWIIKIKIKIAIILLKSVQIYYNEYVNDSQMCYNKKKNIDFLYAELNKMCYNVGVKEENGKEGVVSMFTVFDIANWFLSKEPMTHKKLQKLCYYAQAWSWALRNQPICDANFEAWVHGPVCRELYDKYCICGASLIMSAETFNLDSNAVELLEDVWETYGGLTANALEALTHSETPWRKARVGCDPSERCNAIIQVDDMKQYYQSIYSGNEE